MVGANPYRNPALVAKMATTLDHISGGRAYLGLGAAWNETEPATLASTWASGPPERLRWLREAWVMRGMLPARHRARPAITTGPDVRTIPRRSSRGCRS